MKNMNPEEFFGIKENEQNINSIVSIYNDIEPTRERIAGELLDKLVLS